MTATTDAVDKIVAAFSAPDGAHEFAQCFSPAGVQHHPFFPAPHQGREAIEAAESAMFRGFSEVELVPLRVIEGEGGWATVEWQVSAVNTGPLAMPDGQELEPTGNTVKLTMASVIHLDDDGLIDEEHRYQDNLAFLQQLGLV